MTGDASGDVTRLLQEMGARGEEALAELLPLLYQDLHRLAAQYLGRERANHTLQPTALVHEAYLRLAEQDRVRWQNRSHFIGVAARLMRRILVDHARGHVAAKRGSGATRVILDEAIPAPAGRDVELLDLDDALNKLTALDPRQAEIVDLRYFGGLSIEETAAALDISVATVKREWQMARAWLHRELQRTP